MAASSLSLLPGGLGVVDAAMVLALVAGRVPAATAVPAVLLYRLQPVSAPYRWPDRRLPADGYSTGADGGRRATAQLRWLASIEERPGASGLGEAFGRASAA